MNARGMYVARERSGPPLETPHGVPPRASLHFLGGLEGGHWGGLGGGRDWPDSPSYLLPLGRLLLRQGGASFLDHLLDLGGGHLRGVGLDVEEVDADLGAGVQEGHEVPGLGAAGGAPSGPVVDDGVVGFGQGCEGLAVGSDDAVELVGEGARLDGRAAAVEGAADEGREGGSVVAEPLVHLPALAVIDPELGEREVPLALGEDDLGDPGLDDLGVRGPRRLAGARGGGGSRRGRLRGHGGRGALGRQEDGGQREA